MWIWTASLCAAIMVMTTSCHANPLEAVAPGADCRAQLMERQGPNGAGGWVLVRRDRHPLLCLSGSLEDIDIGRLLETIDHNRKLDVTVRTTGGPVARWMEIAEHLVGKVDVLTVDEACFSSCANYLIPIAGRVVASRDSLVVWHGGPNSHSDNPLEGGDVPAAIDYDMLTERTEKLYARVGFDTGVLALTSEAPSASKFRSTVAAEDRNRPVSGYALSPTRLAKCFGFDNLSAMWHAGGDKAVYDLGKKRSKSIVLLESPRVDRNGEISCNEIGGP